MYIFKVVSFLAINYSHVILFHFFFCMSKVSLDLSMCTFPNFTTKPGLLFSGYSRVGFWWKDLIGSFAHLTIIIEPSYNQFWWFTSVLYMGTFLGSGLQELGFVPNLVGFSFVCTLLYLMPL